MTEIPIQMALRLLRFVNIPTLLYIDFKYLDIFKIHVQAP